MWERLHRLLLDRVGEADEIDWERASLDSASVPAKGGHQNRSESDGQGQCPEGARTKRHVLVEGEGHPVQRSDYGSQHPRPRWSSRVLLDGIKPIRRPRGRPRKRPVKLHADKGYGHLAVQAVRCAGEASRAGSPGRSGEQGEAGAGTGGWWRGRWRGWVGAPQVRGPL